MASLFLAGFYHRDEADCGCQFDGSKRIASFPTENDFFTAKVCNFQPRTTQKSTKKCTPTMRISWSLQMLSLRRITEKSLLREFALQTHTLGLQTGRGTTLAVAQVPSQNEIGT